MKPNICPLQTQNIIQKRFHLDRLHCINKSCQFFVLLHQIFWSISHAYLRIKFENISAQCCFPGHTFQEYQLYNTFCILRVSERLLFNANSAIFQLYHGENKIIFNEMMMRSVLYQTNTLRFLQCQLTETTVHGQTCHPTRTHYRKLGYFGHSFILVYLVPLLKVPKLNIPKNNVR